MVKICPSKSLQAPTSGAFLGTVALAPLPRPPRPRPPRPLFQPCPVRPAFVSRPMSSGIFRFSFRGISRILFSCSSFRTSLAYSFANVLEEFDFCTRPYSNASVDRSGAPNPSGFYLLSSIYSSFAKIWCENYGETQWERKNPLPVSSTKRYFKTQSVHGSSVYRMIPSAQYKPQHSSNQASRKQGIDQTVFGHQEEELMAE